MPTVNLGYTTSLPDAETRERRHKRYQQRTAAAEERQETSAAAQILVDLAESDPAPSVTDLLLKEKDALIENLQEEIVQLKETVLLLTDENSQLRSRLDGVTRLTKQTAGFTADFLEVKDSDYRARFLTGLPNFASFLWLVNLCVSCLPTSKSLNARDLMLLILMKLNLNLKHQDLAWRFDVSSAKVSDVLNKGLPAIAQKLRFLIRWPSKADVTRTMPAKFKRLYPNCRVIIDCTEIFVERASSLTARAMFYSHYKSHPTIKLLIGITPTGAVSFVSKAWGGRVSDKVITLRSGLLDLLENGDQVMADRGFLIDDAVAAKNAVLIRPAFTKGHKQMPVKSIEDSRQQSTLRIHVERLNERLKNFDILNTKMALVMVPHADSIVTICAAICNMYPRLVKKSV